MQQNRLGDYHARSLLTQQLKEKVAQTRQCTLETTALTAQLVRDMKQLQDDIDARKEELKRLNEANARWEYKLQKQQIQLDQQNNRATIFTQILDKALLRWADLSAKHTLIQNKIEQYQLQNSPEEVGEVPAADGVFKALIERMFQAEQDELKWSMQVKAQSAKIYEVKRRNCFLQGQIRNVEADIQDIQAIHIVAPLGVNNSILNESNRKEKSQAHSLAAAQAKFASLSMRSNRLTEQILDYKDWLEQLEKTATSIDTVDQQVDKCKHPSLARLIKKERSTLLNKW